MNIRSLTGLPFETLHRVSSAAYADYVEPHELSQAQLKYMLERRGYRAELSLGAFDGDDMVGFVFNGRRDWNGVPTAYDTGTAVLPGWRRKGVSTRLFRALLPLLREAGVRQYLLEVIRTNAGAVAFYRKSGFETTREFDYYTADPSAVKLDRRPLPDGISIGPLDALDWPRLAAFWDFEPSWQNSVDSVTCKQHNMVKLGAFRGDRVVGYGIIEHGTGDLPQLAVDPRCRRLGLATALVGELLERARPPELRVTNTEVGSAPTGAFLRSLGLEPGAGQYEMILPLTL